MRALKGPAAINSRSAARRKKLLARMAQNAGQFMHRLSRLQTAKSAFPVTPGIWKIYCSLTEYWTRIDHLILHEIVRSDFTPWRGFRSGAREFVPCALAGTGLLFDNLVLAERAKGGLLRLRIFAALLRTRGSLARKSLSRVLSLLLTFAAVTT